MSTRGHFTHVMLGVLLSALLFGSGKYLRATDEAFKAAAAQTTATVIAHSDHHWRDSNNDERIDRADVYQFMTASGQVARFTSPISHSQPRRPIGARAQSLYNPQDPSDARLDDRTHELISTILMWCSPFGLAISAIYLALWLRARRAVPNPS